MKNFSIYKRQDWQFLKFDGRKKIFRDVNRAIFETAQEVSLYRMAHKYVPDIDTRCESLKAIDFCKIGWGTGYEKRIIEGGQHLWFASTVYGHRDYNKSIFATNTERNRRKAALINALAAK